MPLASHDILNDDLQAHAFGRPGIEPKWTRGQKDAIGTAYSASSRLWFTVSAGILNEVYYPTVDRPQIRDLQYLITDGETFCHDERRHLKASIRPLTSHALGYEITSIEPEGRYRLFKQIIAHPHHACVLIHTRLEAGQPLLGKLRLFSPWGESRGDEDIGGYHLVWTRDMFNSATGLLAAGNLETPLRSLVYLACSQLPNGGFHQNFWINGEPYWTGIQLDEVAFPIILAWRLREAWALHDFDPYPMVLRAASYLVRMGPTTPQERWEENSGYSPSMLASNIAALICAASFARLRGDANTALFLEQYADFLESHLESRTVTTQGTLLPDVTRHFIRIHPTDVTNMEPDEDPNYGILPIRNKAPGQVHRYRAKDIVDGGFLELVRYGIRAPDDPLIVDSLRVIDAVLKVDAPAGPWWRRYSHDGYGQRADGGPFEGWGQGRAWPLLTGERGHYELAAGRDVTPYLRALEGFANECGLLPEQIWDAPDLPEKFPYFGKPTGALMPLMWAHAEYIKLLRSANDGKVFDLIPEVADRYVHHRNNAAWEVWKFNRRIKSVQAGTTLRIKAPAPFRLH